MSLFLLIHVFAYGVVWLCEHLSGMEEAFVLTADDYAFRIPVFYRGTVNSHNGV